jgi:LysR family hydrogen peroxide-inducible transcriptional activator
LYKSNQYILYKYKYYLYFIFIIMTINQLEYVIAVDNYRHFVTAAEKCYVTQPTLSMQIQKLEEELGIAIFNRRVQPVIPTNTGKELIDQARIVIREFNKINEKVKILKNEIKGQLKIGMIPTLAPYLLPLFVKKFTKKYPDIELVVDEFVSEEIVQLLRKDMLDIGILSTPLKETDIMEIPLFYEKILIFIDNQHYLSDMENIKAKDIPLNDLWTLSNKHCFNTQVINLCKKNKSRGKKSNFTYQSGSFENLIKFSEITHQLTLIPELLMPGINEDKRKMVKEIIEPVPAREISIVVHKSFVKEYIINILKQEILLGIPDEMKNKKDLEIIEWK